MLKKIFFVSTLLTGFFQGSQAYSQVQTINYTELEQRMQGNQIGQISEKSAEEIGEERKKIEESFFKLSLTKTKAYKEALRKHSKIKIVTDACVQKQMVDFAKDASVTGHIHIQMAASQFNSAEFMSPNKVVDSAMSYAEDLTQGPLCQLANPMQAQFLLERARTDRNPEGFLGFREGFHSFTASDGSKKDLSVFVKNGYFKYAKKEDPKLVLAGLQKSYQHIQSTVVESMPVYGKVINSNHYLYSDEPFGLVDMVTASAIPCYEHFDPSLSHKLLETKHSILSLAQRAAFEVTVQHGVLRWYRAFKEAGFNLEKVPQVTVHLTLIGTGVFSNPIEVCMEAMKNSILRFARNVPVSFTIEVFRWKDGQKKGGQKKVVEETVDEINAELVAFDERGAGQKGPRTETVESVDSGEAETVEPVDSGEAETVEPVDSGEAETVEAVDSGEAETVEAVDSGEAETVEAVDSGEAETVDSSGTKSQNTETNTVVSFTITSKKNFLGIETFFLSNGTEEIRISTNLAKAIKKSNKNEINWSLLSKFERDKKLTRKKFKKLVTNFL